MRRDILEEDLEMEEEDIYTAEGIDFSYDDDGISSWEEGFMKGYLAG